MTPDHLNPLLHHFTRAQESLRELQEALPNLDEEPRTARTEILPHLQTTVLDLEAHLETVRIEILKLYNLTEKGEPK